MSERTVQEIGEGCEGCFARACAAERRSAQCGAGGDGCGCWEKRSTSCSPRMRKTMKIATKMKHDGELSAAVERLKLTDKARLARDGGAGAIGDGAA